MRIASDAMIIDRPTPGVWLVHERTQRPVEGVAVYQYTWGFVCEQCGPERPGEPGCVHIGLVKLSQPENNSH